MITSSCGKLAATYAVLWHTLRRVASDQDLRPNVVLLVLAVSEGASDTAALEAVFLAHDSVSRRALADAYAAELVVGNAVGGGEKRPGVRTAVKLTGRGQKVVALVHETIDGLESEQDRG